MIKDRIWQWVDDNLNPMDSTGRLRILLFCGVIFFLGAITRPLIAFLVVVLIAIIVWRVLDRRKKEGLKE